MIRTWQLLLFGVCLAVVLTALAWTSATVVRLDLDAQRARAEAALEENVRLALWRLDSWLAQWIGQENVRPVAFYDQPVALSEAHTSPSTSGSVESSYVLLYFQVLPTGEIVSPQVAADGKGKSVAKIDEAALARLNEARTFLERDRLLASLPVGPPPVSTPATAALGPGSLAQSEPPEEDGPGEIGNQFNQLAQRANPASQSGRNHAEFQARSQVLQQRVLPEPQVPAPSPSEQVQAAALVPVWVDNRLLLIRRVQRSAGTSLQGCWIDWPALRAAMLSSVHDLAPGATLEKVDAAVPADVGRMLASLPARLVPASRVATFASASAPIRFSLTVAWIGTLAAALAVAGLMWGVLVLAHRRDAFVSAVTHELRTPLTTFRMYTEMLAGGMVSDEATRRRYLETLRTEADRLMHLVENVLAYARLERGRRQPTADVALDDLLRQTTPRLAQRAESAGMRLVVRQGESTSSVHVRCDVGGVEQILFNLVDNACKYASVPQGVIELEASIQNGRVQLCVSDSGPGISRRDARRLFRSFRKSASEAAQTAPGVGLGLALSRRLARQQSGDLRLLPSPRGACFALTLPTTDP